MSVWSVLLIILIGGLFFWMMKKGGCCGMGHSGHGGHGSSGGEQGHSGHGGASGTATSQMAKDPICGMTVDAQHAISSQHMGHTFYFCSSVCKENFERDPMKYMKKEAESGGCGG